MKIKKNIAISDAGLVFNPVNGESFSVNPIGTEILNLIREGKPADKIPAIILQRYNTDKDTVEKDLQDFIGILKQYQLTEEDEEKKA
jgi:hypothetical protein